MALQRMADPHFVFQSPAEGLVDAFQFFVIINQSVVSSVGVPPCANGLGFLKNDFPHTCWGISITLGSLLNVHFTRSVPGRSEFGAQESSLCFNGTSVVPGTGEV